MRPARSTPRRPRRCAPTSPPAVAPETSSPDPPPARSQAGPLMAIVALSVALAAAVGWMIVELRARETAARGEVARVADRLDDAEIEGSRLRPGGRHRRGRPRRCLPPGRSDARGPRRAGTARRGLGCGPGA